MICASLCTIICDEAPSQAAPRRTIADEHRVATRPKSARRCARPRPAAGLPRPATPGPRRHRPCKVAAWLQRAGDPGLSRRATGLEAVRNQVQRPPACRMAAKGVLAPVRPRSAYACRQLTAILPASILVRIPPRDNSEAGAPRHGVDLGRDSLDDRDQLARVRVGGGRARCRARRYRRTARARSAPDHGRDAGRQPVIIAIADLGRGDGVVLVDHRHGAKVEQASEHRGARIEIAPPLFGVRRASAGSGRR